jgi:hypothetical protein
MQLWSKGMPTITLTWTSTSNSQKLSRAALLAGTKAQRNPGSDRECKWFLMNRRCLTVIFPMAFWGCHATNLQILTPCLVGNSSCPTIKIQCQKAALSKPVPEEASPIRHSVQVKWLVQWELIIKVATRWLFGSQPSQLASIWYSSSFSCSFHIKAPSMVQPQVSRLSTRLLCCTPSVWVRANSLAMRLNCRMTSHYL